MRVILVVDDSEDVLETVAATLRSIPMTLVQTAPSGQSALEQARARDFDLFLVDANMPEMTGIKLLKILKCEFSHTPVIVMSEDAMMRHRAILGGADGVLEKPFRQEQLRELVLGFLYVPTNHP